MRSNIQSSDQSARSFIETARRAQIIDRAVETIAELGYAQTSLAKIAKRAGISTGVISYYFAGKDDLIAEVVAHVFAVGEAFIRARVGDPATARETLRAFIEASIAYIGAHPQNGLAVMNIIRAGRTEQGDQRFDPTVGESRRDAITSICEWGQREGEFRAFSIPVLRVALIEALDAAPQELALDPDLDMAAFGRELAELFDRATRKDP